MIAQLIEGINCNIKLPGLNPCLKRFLILYDWWTMTDMYEHYFFVNFVSIAKLGICLNLQSQDFCQKFNDLFVCIQLVVTCKGFEEDERHFQVNVENLAIFISLDNVIVVVQLYCM